MPNPEYLDICDQRAGFDPFLTANDFAMFVTIVADWARTLPEDVREGFPWEFLNKVQEHLSHDRQYEVAFSNQVPRDMWHALEAYVHEGRELGGFLQAVVENNLSRAVSVADQRNRRCLQGLVWAVSSMVPSVAYGSHLAYLGWVEKHEKHLPPDLRDHPR